MKKKCLAAVLAAVLLSGSMACTTSMPPSTDTGESTSVQNTVENVTEGDTHIESEPETEYDWSQWEPSEGADVTELAVVGGQYTGGDVKVTNVTYSYKKNPDLFVFYQAEGSGSSIMLEAGKVAAVYAVPVCEDDTVATYSANISIGARKAATHATQYIGLRLRDGNNGANDKAGVWIALREDEIGLRTGAWPETTYTPIKAEGVNFKTSRMLYIEDDMKTDIITVSAENDSGEKVVIAEISIDGTTVSLYHPGEDTPAIQDTGVDVPGTGYVRYWAHHIEGDKTVLNNLTVSGVVKEKTEVVLEANMLASKDVLSDTWVSVDDEGRVSGYVGKPATDKKVGIFYFLWHDGTSDQPIYDHTKAFMEGGADALIEVIQSGPLGFAHYWAEPYFGYYQSNDEWVIRKHAMQLTAAGVDFIYIDATNGLTYAKNYMAILKVWSEMRAEGYDTPQIAFHCGNTDSNARASFAEIWNNLYSKGIYEELWFKYEGKPLVFMPRSVYTGLSKEQKEFINYRQSWAVVTDADTWYYDSKGRDCWPWATFYPQKPGLSGTGELEQMVVMCGFWANGSFGTNAGRSYAGGVQPPSLGLSDFSFSLLETATGKGLAFEEQFDYAIEQDPGIIMLTGWNEWWAGRWETDDPDSLIANTYVPTNDDRWIRSYYWDAFNPEYSRDIEPVKGLFNDNYYYQMVQNIREYKGSRAPLAAFGQRPIDMAGVQSQWDIVGPEYRDYVGDTAHRDHMSYVGQLHYTNTTGRNDLATAKVSRYGDDVWFYIECAADITSPEGTNWMNLFINADCQQEMGWYGYDYVINRDRDGGTCSIQRFADGKWEMTEVGRADYTVNGRYMVVKLDAKALGLGDTFDFKWADNSVDSGDIMQFIDLGDTAPNDRFNYRYTATAAEQVLPETLTADMVVLKAGSYFAFVEGKMVRLDETTTKATFFGDDEHLYLPFEFAKSVNLAKEGDKTYNHYGVAYVDITAALESCGKTVTRSEDMLVLADKALTDDEMLILYRAMY